MIADAQAGDILRAMVPFLKAGKYAEATYQAIYSASFRVTGKGVELPESVDLRASRRADRSKERAFSRIELLLMALGIGLFLWNARRGGRRRFGTKLCHGRDDVLCSVIFRRISRL